MKTESGINLVLIAQGPSLKCSVTVLDSQMNQKLLPELEGVKVTQVAQPVHEGHLFALDENNNMIAINLKLLCHGDGYSPYQIMSFSKYGGGSVIYNDLKSIWALHSSGEMQKL